MRFNTRPFQSINIPLLWDPTLSISDPLRTLPGSPSRPIPC